MGSGRSTRMAVGVGVEASLAHVTGAHAPVAEGGRVVVMNSQGEDGFISRKIAAMVAAETRVVSSSMVVGWEVVSVQLDLKLSLEVWRLGEIYNPLVNTLYEPRMLVVTLRQIS